MEFYDQRKSTNKDIIQELHVLLDKHLDNVNQMMVNENNVKRMDYINVCLEELSTKFNTSVDNLFKLNEEMDFFPVTEVLDNKIDELMTKSREEFVKCFGKEEKVIFTKELKLVVLTF